MALPHLGGSGKPRVTAPHLAGPPLASTSLPGAGRRGGAGGGTLSPREADSGEGARVPWASLLRAGEVQLGRGRLKEPGGQVGRGNTRWWGRPPLMGCEGRWAGGVGGLGGEGAPRSRTLKEDTEERIWSTMLGPSSYSILPPGVFYIH